MQGTEKPDRELLDALGLCGALRFALLRRGDTLTDADRARLDKLFDAHPRLKAGWQALQELHGLYLADDYDGALKSPGAVLRPLRDRRAARVPRHSYWWGLAAGRV